MRDHFHLSLIPGERAPSVPPHPEERALRARLEGRGAASARAHDSKQRLLTVRIAISSDRMTRTPALASALCHRIAPPAGKPLASAASLRCVLRSQDAGNFARIYLEARRSAESGLSTASRRGIEMKLSRAARDGLAQRRRARRRLAQIHALVLLIAPFAAVGRAEAQCAPNSPVNNTTVTCTGTTTNATETATAPRPIPATPTISSPALR